MKARKCDKEWGKSDLSEGMRVVDVFLLGGD